MKIRNKQTKVLNDRVFKQMGEDEGTAVDIYRDTPVRLLGYANEVGEAFRALVHVRWVKLSYVVASGYVLADTQDKAGKALKEGADAKNVGIAAMDTLVWQAFASVIVPGQNSFSYNENYELASLTSAGRAFQEISMSHCDQGDHAGMENSRKWAVTGLGLGAIPFIVHPIDNLVHTAMDHTTRKWFGP
ncbi:mitochondrial fission process protein 1 [Eurytemora carolleeae]|uniref:mitochondrial fission process protein 1 n=1 Tax=Eurytemora carolleeae TaxID=1294199 RepID=UPI000C78F928|nr:mitochondrial fission process protein 1 [Eurytemora carolleeae]|eukprot:XP_023348745.1 mitochondrial fission process protein 1-like [Eurytemora affinis]